jgi:hypothetical protein
MASAAGRDELKKHLGVPSAFMAELTEIKEEEVVEHFLKSLGSGKSNG